MRQQHAVHDDAVSSASVTVRLHELQIYRMGDVTGWAVAGFSVRAAAHAFVSMPHTIPVSLKAALFNAGYSARGRMSVSERTLLIEAKGELRPLTKYEYARLVAARAEALSNNAPPILFPTKSCVIAQAIAETHNGQGEATLYVNGSAASQAYHIRSHPLPTSFALPPLPVALPASSSSQDISCDRRAMDSSGTVEEVVGQVH